MRLNDFLHGDFVIPRLEATDRDGVVAEISRKAAAAGIADEGTVRERLLERERLHPTVMGSGLAIPHAVIPELTKPVLGVALTGGRDVSFGPGEQDGVRVFFVVLCPEGHEGEHVRILARICRLLRHDALIGRLEAAGEPGRILELIETADLPQA